MGRWCELEDIVNGKMVLMGRWCAWEDIYNYKDDGWEEGLYKVGK